MPMPHQATMRVGCQWLAGPGGSGDTCSGREEAIPPSLPLHHREYSKENGQKEPGHKLRGIRIVINMSRQEKVPSAIIYPLRIPTEPNCGGGGGGEWGAVSQAREDSFARVISAGGAGSGDDLALGFYHPPSP